MDVFEDEQFDKLPVHVVSNGRSCWPPIQKPEKGQQSWEKWKYGIAEHAKNLDNLNCFHGRVWRQTDFIVGANYHVECKDIGFSSPIPKPAKRSLALSPGNGRHSFQNIWICFLIKYSIHLYLSNITCPKGSTKSLAQEFSKLLSMTKWIGWNKIGWSSRQQTRQQQTIDFTTHKHYMLWD